VIVMVRCSSNIWPCTRENQARRVIPFNGFWIMGMVPTAW
jgi:hypothetical protein